MSTLKLKAASSGEVQLTVPSTIANQTIIFPAAAPTAGKALKATNTSGTLEWGSIDIANLSASGTASSSTFLRGDNTWSTVTDGGDVVDWKYVNKTDVFSEASIAAGGVSGAAISISYTAASTSNRLLITANLMINTTQARHGVIAYKDGSAFARGDAHPDSQNNLARVSASGYNEGASYTMDSMPFQFIDTPADTSAHTYDFRIWNGKNGSTTVYLNRTSTNDNYSYLQGTGMSSISILELKPQQT